MTQPANVDYSNLPLWPAWYLPGWTSQNAQNDYLPAPTGNPFTAVPFPDLNYVLVTGEEFDPDGNPLGGYFQFMPSDNITVAGTDSEGNPTSTRIMRRYTGSDVFDQMGYNQAGSGRVYIWHGRLAVLLLATDNAGLVTDKNEPLFYYVKEKFWGGQSYQITVPWNTVGAGPVDIRSLITSAPWIEPTPPVTRISALSTENIVINASSAYDNLTNLNLSAYEVDFAFMTGYKQPGDADWIEGNWITFQPPYTATLLIGPENNGVVLPTGTYTIWVRMLLDEQIPVFKTGTLIIN